LTPDAALTPLRAVRQLAGEAEALADGLFALLSTLPCSPWALGTAIALLAAEAARRRYRNQPGPGPDEPAPWADSPEWGA
jgi:hypothetical protein